MKKIVCLLLIITFLFTGCENRIELSEFGIVTMLGIDWDSDKKEYQTTIVMIRTTPAIPGDTIQTRNNSWVASATGATIHGAVENLRTRSQQNISLITTSIILIGNDAAEYGFENILDFLTRYRDIRDTAYVLSTNAKAYEIMKLLPEKSRGIRYEIEGIVENADWAGVYAPRLRDVYVEYNENNKDFITGAVFRTKPFPYNKVPRKEAEEDEGSNYVVSLAGSTVYKEGKSAGFFDDADTMSYTMVMKPSWIQSESWIAVLDTGGLNKSKVAYETEGSTSKIDVSVIDNNINVDISIKIKGKIVELNSIEKNTDIEFLDELRVMINEKFKNEIENMIYKVKDQYKADILGIGSLVHKKYPKYWKDNEKMWEEIYSNVKFNVSVDSKISSVGLTIKPLREE